MRLLDRYILKSALLLFFWCIASFLFLYVIIDLFSHLDVILNHKIGLDILRQYYVSLFPLVFVQIAPFACLLATLYTFAKLNHDNEIIAMRSSGLSILQITRTVIVLGILISTFIFWLNDRIVPRWRYRNEQIAKQMETSASKNKQKQLQVMRNVSVFGSKNRLFFIERFYPANGTMEDIIILEDDVMQNTIKKIMAPRATYQDGIWRFYQSFTYAFDESGMPKDDPRYLEEEIMAIPETPQDFANPKKSAEYMNLSQIESYIWKFSRSGAKAVIRDLKVDYYQRFTVPLTSLIIILLGIPFSMKIRKRATGLSSFGLALMLGFLYYVLNAVSIAFGKAGILYPFLAASLSHLLALALSVYMIGTLP